jgi:hypothetical protein
MPIIIRTIYYINRFFIVMKNEKRAKLLFIVPNIILSVILMVFYFIKNEPNFPYSIIPSYFLSVIGAIFVMYVIHPSVKPGVYYSKSVKIFIIVIFLLMFLISALIIVFET